MGKTIRLVQNYIIYSLPLVIVCMVWSTISPEKEVLKDASLATKVLWETLSWNLILWFVVLIAFLISMITIREVRETTLKRLAYIKERDEREQFITGNASRAAYLATLSLLVCLLFFSIFTLNIQRVPESEAVNGKRGTVSIGLQFKLLDKPQIETNGATGLTFFESKGIPLSKTAILLILILWQLAAFNYTARREHLRDLND